MRGACVVLLPRRQINLIRWLHLLHDSTIFKQTFEYSAEDDILAKDQSNDKANTVSLFTTTDNN